MFCLKLTVPCIYEPWSKPLFALHAFMAPLTLCFAFKCEDIFNKNLNFSGQKIPLSDGLNGGELALLFASLLAICVVLFTSKQREPGCYKWVCSYAGFVVSIAWIYATAAEVVGNLENLKKFNFFPVECCTYVREFVQNSAPNSRPDCNLMVC